MQEFNLELIDIELNEIYDMADNINVLINKLIELLIKTQNEGNNFNETDLNVYFFQIRLQMKFLNGLKRIK